MDFIFGRFSMNLLLGGELGVFSIKRLCCLTNVHVVLHFRKHVIYTIVINCKYQKRLKDFKKIKLGSGSVNSVFDLGPVSLTREEIFHCLNRGELISYHTRLTSEENVRRIRLCLHPNQKPRHSKRETQGSSSAV